MGNIGVHSGQISGSQESGLCTELMGAKRYLAPKLLVRSSPKTAIQPQAQVKVLPDLKLGQSLRNTNNGDILHSGGTLSGRRQTRMQNEQSRPYSPTQRYSFHKIGLESRLNGSKRKTLNHQFNLSRSESEPVLRFASSKGQEIGGKRKKYKAPPPPIKAAVPQNQSTNWDENLCDENPSRRPRLFKTRFQSKKESSQALNIFVQSTEKNNSDIVEDQIQARKNTNILQQKSLFEINFPDSDEFKKELREATDRLRAAKVDTVNPEGQFEPFKNIKNTEVLPNTDFLIERRCPRGEPSGKESSTPEASPILGSTDLQKPRTFYFGMEREDSDASSSYPIEDDEENLTIALRLRPVLPRKPTQIPRFSPAIAWKLLDARSQDSGISGDARPPLPPFSWTPQQDLEDDSSIDETIREEPKSVRKQRQSPHVFSLSLPRDHHPAAFLATMTSNKSCGSSLKRLKRSVSGVLNTLSNKREQEKLTVSRDDSNWFFTRSAPNSLNENSLEIPEACFPHISSTSRLMYLPETTVKTSSVQDKRFPSSAFAKSCEELRIPQSLRDTKTVLDIPWSKEKKNKKFTFQSTVRQIERKRVADKLSKEAEKKEKQRLRELEAMRQVEEEFQRKRAKEKANIRQQLRLYAMNDNQWTSLPFDINLKTEERQEPDGALSSSNSSLSSPRTQNETRNNKTLEGNTIAHVTKELSEYRQTQRDFKEYRGSKKYLADNRNFKQTTVHAQVTCNMPSVKGLNLETGNYRKEFASGMKSTKSIGSSQSEDFQHNYSPKMYRNKYSPITRF